MIFPELKMESKKNVRRMMANYSNFELTRDSILESALAEELIGCAFDVENSLVYLQLRDQKRIGQWSKIPCLKVLRHWESKENIETFAHRNHFLFVPGQAYDGQASKSKGEKDEEMEILLEMIAQGLSLEEIEEQLFLSHNLSSLALLSKNKAELKSFSEALDKIKNRIQKTEEKTSRREKTDMIIR